MKSVATPCIFRLFFLILPFNTNIIYAQSTVPESSLVQGALANTRSVYHQSFYDQSALYNGQEYAEYLFGFEKGQPFFYSAGAVAGSITYDGVTYDSVMMRYDEIKDVLVINNHVSRIQLWNEKVEGFNLYNSDFVNVIKDSLSGIQMSSGFYNLLYKGKVWLLKKQSKVIMEKFTSSGELFRIIDEKDYYYIKKDDKFYPVKSKKNLFEIFGNDTKEVQRFVKDNGLNFRKDPQNMLTKATAYYDSLKK